MELQLTNSNNKLELTDAVFACDFNEALIHQVVTAYMAAGRAGTKAQKTRAEVSGGGVKPFKQKGTGRARAGTIRSPLWRKGGIVFAAKPRSFKQKVNRKMYKGALRSILSELIRQDRLLVVEGFTVGSCKTKELISKLSELKVEGRLLVIVDNMTSDLYLSARNLPHVEIRDAVAAMADPVYLIHVDKVIITQAAIKELEGWLK
jgi:large subunit ribosomal protein L4